VFYKKGVMLNKPPSYACDVVSLRDAKAYGAEWVEVYDAHSKCTYRAPMNVFDEYGFTFDRGYGIQKGLTLNWWDIIGTSGGNLYAQR
jgi:hypothetical protein